MVAARAASAVAVGATALGDKAGDDPVEAQAVVKAFADELGEVGYRTRASFSNNSIVMVPRSISITAFFMEISLFSFVIVFIISCMSGVMLTFRVYVKEKKVAP